jgi:hypothetical protein
MFFFPLFLCLLHPSPLQEHEQDDALSCVPADAVSAGCAASQPYCRSAGVFSPCNASIRQFTLFVPVSDRWTLAYYLMLVFCRFAEETWTDYLLNSLM